MYLYSRVCCVQENNGNEPPNSGSMEIGQHKICEVLRYYRCSGLKTLHRKIAAIYS